ncbi:negative regulator of beta-lactamase expression [Methylophilaceae bacterium 11]|jgi:AmpD protein|uniref:1,6-anhydro-N-acetylmuramyl-L-alanine amidase AmpD n=1 Tax=unclassified Methylotenera TaxID=2643294 RepID=UPI000381C7E1|nr:MULTISPECIES: 1,6-anhydro-N-acetylmuramyl-L-alanine amidase AmpD [unclassified Methylotenera]EUJ09500.1 negative regulator of beta-lactamase expression [Methylophilaceae bacterium 11]
MKALEIDQAGWIVREDDDDGIQHILSPNFDARPECAIDMIVIHNISLPPFEYGGTGVIELFTNQLNPDEHPYYAEIQALKVSSHFFIRRDGSLMQFVSCLARAWHAGASTWQNRERCNDFSVGIELEGSDITPFEAEQYATLVQLIQALIARYPIQHVVGHADIAPGRKTDPGPYFDWDKVNTLIKI